MTILRAQFFKFKLNEEAFKNAFVDAFSEQMLISARFAYMLSIRLVPVWTGESRGGFRELAKTLKAPLGGVFGEATRRRKNRHGRIKTPISAISEVHGPEVKGNKIEFTVVNDADGFTFNDRSGPASNLRHVGPWGFNETFARKLNQDLRIRLKKVKIPLERYAVRIGVT